MKPREGQLRMHLCSFLVALGSWGEPEHVTLDLGLSTTPQHF